MKKLNYIKLKKELIELLESYLKNPDNKITHKKLSSLWWYYFNTYSFMKKEFNDVLGIGEDFMCDIKPSKKRVEEILKNLKNVKL